MTDTHTTGAPAPAPPPRHGRIRRALHWLRDYDSDGAREHYVRFGIWTSRVYAVLIPATLALLAFLEPRVSEVIMLDMTLAFCVVWGNVYYWYQGKEIIAYPVVQEDHANADLMNSIWPAISIGVLVILWLVIKSFHMVGWMTFELSYTGYGWIILAFAAWQVLYDLRVNTKVTFILSKVPGRQDYAAPQPPPH